MTIKEQMDDLLGKVGQAALLLKELEDDVETKRQQIGSLQRQFNQLQGGVGALRDRMRLDEALREPVMADAPEKLNGGGPKTTPLNPELEEAAPDGG